MSCSPVRVFRPARQDNDRKLSSWIVCKSGDFRGVETVVTGELAASGGIVGTLYSSIAVAPIYRVCFSPIRQYVVLVPNNISLDV